MKQIFESERIRYTRVSETLVKDYLGMVNDIEHVERYLGGFHEPYTERQELEWVRKKLAEKAIVFSMLEKERGAFIGTIELDDVNDSEGELGIALTAAMQNLGYGREAVAAMTAYGMEILGLKRIRLRVNPENARAIHVYETCGFREYRRTPDHVYMEITVSYPDFSHAVNTLAVKRTSMRKLFEMDKRDYSDCKYLFRRDSARSIILRAGKVAMIHSLKYDYYKFPGGGIERTESPEEAMIRETREESGLIVIPESVKEFGYVHRVQRSDRDPQQCFVQENYYYLCKALSEPAAQDLDDYEAQESYQLEFVEPAAAIEKNRGALEHTPYHPMMLEREARILEMLRSEGYF